ncbi:MAG: carboxypeptidase-like regulatory domain-containing protein [Flavobacterium sp.]|nr:carboxypeptidase-like regulatory domain-containing protein [Flavobacterium sp.]
MKIKFLFFAILLSAISFAQNATVSGKILDKEMNNEPLPFATVLIKETKQNTATDENGNYSFSMQPGSYTLVISYLGYVTKEIPFAVSAGELKTINHTLASTGGEELKEVVIEVQVNKEKESALLQEQQKAVEIKQSIGSQELSRKGVSDVATAVTKTTGITKQEGSGNIFVRGLGDRYNSTTMNGLPVPSNDPEKKNLALDIFSTDIVEYVSIDKVYGSKLFGDFAGGNVDIASKDYKGKGFIKAELGSKLNTNAMNEEFTLMKGYSNFGFGTSAIPSNSLTTYNFNSLALEKRNPLATSFGISGGDSFSVGNNGKINVFFTLGHGNEYAAISDGTAKGNVNGNGVIFKNFNKYTSNSFTTNTTGMANLNYKINSNNKINFNSVFINTSTLSKEEYTGFIVDIANDGNGLVRRNQYDRNNLLINQLLGDHKFNDRMKFNWGVSYNVIKGYQPDRNQNTFRKENAGYVLSSISAADNHRYFQNLTENEIALNTSLDYKFSKNEDGDFRGKITIGYAARSKTRDFEATQFNFKANNAFTNTIVDPNNLDLFYNQTNYANNYFEISTFRGGAQVSNALNPQTYNGELLISGGYVNTEYKFNKLTAVVGLRSEYIFQKISWNTSLDPIGGKDELIKLAFLPNMVLKYELNDRNNLRFGASKTYTLPQFIERALFIYEKVNESKIGNPNLYESDDYNFDLKWEFFPKNEELISVTAFGKYIQNPMNEVTIASSTNDISYVNTGDFGYVAGAEIEYRKLLFSFDSANTKKLSGGINASYLYSEQDLSSTKVIKETDYNVAFTNKTSKFTGASDLLLNADLSFLNEWNDKKNNVTTTLAYSHFSDRIYAIGTNDRGNLIDKGFGSLDFIAKSKINNKWNLGIVFKNILNPSIERVQENTNETINVLSYKKGINFSVNINYQF